jgi:hypothetical protein
MWGGKKIHSFQLFNTAFQAAVALGSWEGKWQGGEEGGRKGGRSERGSLNGREPSRETGLSASFFNF